MKKSDVLNKILTAVNEIAENTRFSNSKATVQKQKINNIPESFHTKEFLTSNDICKTLQISHRSLYNFRERYNIPYVKLGRKMVFKSADVIDFLRNNYTKF
jgi:predicted DNA-binding transcriptional regulator AlpA